MDKSGTHASSSPSDDSAGQAMAWIGVTPRQLAGFLAMVFGMFMAILDIQIVSASLTEIQAGLSASSDEIAWVQTVVSHRRSRDDPVIGISGAGASRRAFCSFTAAVGFTAASVLCATATSIDQMIVYRAMQGFIGGGMIPSVFAVAFSLFPRSKQAIVSPIIGLVATLAPTIGPTVGGYLTDTYSWHWLFLINVDPGHRRRDRGLFPRRLRQAELTALLDRFDFVGLIGMALVPRLARVRARGRPSLRLVR